MKRIICCSRSHAHALWQMWLWPWKTCTKPALCTSVLLKTKDRKNTHNISWKTCNIWIHGRMIKKERDGVWLSVLKGHLFLCGSGLILKAGLLWHCVCGCVCFSVCLSLVVWKELVTREVNLVFVEQISLQPLVLREHSVLRRRKTYVINYLFPLTLPSFI